MTELDMVLVYMHPAVQCLILEQNPTMPGHYSCKTCFVEFHCELKH